MFTAYGWPAKSYEQKGLYEQAIEAYLKAGEFSSLGPEAEAALKETYAASGWKGFWQKALNLEKAQANKRMFLARTRSRRFMRGLERRIKPSPGWRRHLRNADGA